MVRDYNIGNETNDVYFTWVLYFCVVSVSRLMSSTNSARNNIFRLASKVRFFRQFICAKTDISLDLNSFSSIFLSFYFALSGNEIKIFICLDFFLMSRGAVGLKKANHVISIV